MKLDIDSSINCGKGSSIDGLNYPSYTAPNLLGGVLSGALVESEIFPSFFVICFKWEKENVDFRQQVEWKCDLLS